MRLAPRRSCAMLRDRLPELLDDVMLHTNARPIAFIAPLALAGCSGGIDPGIAQMLVLLGGLLTIPLVWRALKGSFDERREEARHQSPGSIYGGTSTGDVSAGGDHGDAPHEGGNSGHAPGHGGSSSDSAAGGGSSDGGGDSGGGGD